MLIQKLKKKLINTPKVRGQQRVVAAVSDTRGRIISIGHNSYTKSHPLQKKYAHRAGRPLKEYLHAEVAALLRARGRGYKLTVVRLDKHDNLALAMPCVCCQEAIKASGISIVEYSV